MLNSKPTLHGDCEFIFYELLLKVCLNIVTVPLCNYIIRVHHAEELAHPHKIDSLREPFNASFLRKQILFKVYQSSISYV